MATKDYKRNPGTLKVLGFFLVGTHVLATSEKPTRGELKRDCRATEGGLDKFRVVLTKRGSEIEDINEPECFLI